MNKTIYLAEVIETTRKQSKANKRAIIDDLKKAFTKYEGLKLHGATVTGILEAYNMCQLQPDPGFSDDNNYLKNVIAEETHLDCFGELPKESVILADGTDVTEEVLKAEKWLIENSF